jgi:hypothetical protein
MEKRAVDLSDDELTSIFRAATANVSLEAAQCGLSVGGSVRAQNAGGALSYQLALRTPAGDIVLINDKPTATGKKRANAA